MPLTLKLRPATDSYFTITGWELQALRHFHRVAENHMPEMLQRYEISEDARDGAAFPPDLALMMIEARIPAMLRNPVLIAAWSLFETCAVETSHFFQKKVPLTYSVSSADIEVPEALRKRWRKWNVIDRTQHFYSTELGFNGIPEPDLERDLQDLRILRNVLVHSSGRRSSEKPQDWERLRNISARNPGLQVETGYVVVSAGFVRGQLELVDRATTHLVEKSREVLEAKGLAKRGRDA